MSNILPASDPEASKPDRQWIGAKGVEGGLKRTAVRSWAVNAVGQGVKFMINLGSTAIIARMLTPNDYGLVAMATAFFTFITLFRDLGLSQATVQRKTLTEAQSTGMFWFNVLMGVAIMLLTAAISPLVSLFYGQPNLTWICLAFAAMAPIGSLGAQHAALLQRAMQFRSLVLRDILATSVGAAAGIFCAMHGIGYWSLVIMQAVSQVMGTVTLWWQSGWRPGPPRWSQELKPLIRFGGTLTLSNILGFVMSGLDSVVIGYFFGPVGLGVYNRAQNILSRPLKQILPPIMTVTSSAFARVAHDPKKFETAALQLAFLISCVSCLLVAITVTCADWVVLIMLGHNWDGAVPITQVLALFAFVEPIGSMLATLLTARGLPDKLVKWRIISASIILTGLLSGLHWGPLGVATAYAVNGLLIRTPIFIFYSGKHLQIQPIRIFGAISGPVASGLLAAIAMTVVRYKIWAPSNVFAGLIFVGIIGAAVFGASLWMFDYSRNHLKATIRLARESMRSRQFAKTSANAT